MDRKQQRRPKDPRAKPRPHPLYGNIPMVAQEIRDARGAVHIVYLYDPDYKPDLPPGALRGDIRRQNLCFAHNVPKYFYTDHDLVCVQCGVTFVFRATEQKFWYESLGFYGTSIAIRCLLCRRKQRTQKALSAQVAAARSALLADPADSADPAALLALAESLVRYHQRTARGNLEEAIAACRRFRKLEPLAGEPLFWEGLAHIESGRVEKGREFLRRFVATPPACRRDRDLIAEAAKVLDAQPPPGSSQA